MSKRADRIFRIVRDNLNEKSALLRPDDVDSEDAPDLQSRRDKLAKHLKSIKQGKSKPEQEEAPNKPQPWNDAYHESEPHPDRKGPGGDGSHWNRTHAQHSGDLAADKIGARGAEADSHREDFEKAVSKREKQASRLSKRNKK